MKIESTRALRPVCSSVHRTIGDLPSGFFNFGLYFQKWFYVIDGTGESSRWKRGDPWKCSLSDESDVVKGIDYCEPNRSLDNLHVSLCLFNGENSYTRKRPKIDKGRWREDPNASMSITQRWDRTGAEAYLKKKNGSLDEFCSNAESLGYKSYRLTASLVSPLIVGLGNEHPSEKGFRFDWTLGIPMIPASSIKGVVRLAFLVNQLNSFDNPHDPRLIEFLQAIAQDNNLPEPARSFFGSGGDKTALRGSVIFLDAYPETLPRLKAEIMNCHYPEYLNEGKRGPTEDQNPNPQRYWAVDPYLENRKRLNFVFRFLVHRTIADDSDRNELFCKAVHEALQAHGLGAKTAVGHGRFAVDQKTAEQKGLLREAPESPATRKQSAPARETTEETWPGAHVTWNPGRSEFEARYGQKKAAAKDMNLVAEGLRDKLKKKKAIKALVTVRHEAGDLYTLLSVGNRQDT